jgi:hypothetical protein
MSRRGTARNESDQHLDNVSYIKGNCLHPDSFSSALTDVDSVVHTVGTLLPSSKPELSYKEMNRDAAVNVATILNEKAKAAGTMRDFVMLGSAKAPFFAQEYVTRKNEAEEFIINECDHLRLHSL